MNEAWIVGGKQFRQNRSRNHILENQWVFAILSNEGDDCEE